MSVAKKLYTIGHSNHPIERFVELLSEHSIATLVDVRSRPYSRWAPHFQKNALLRSLRDAGVEYVFLGDKLGGRPEGAEYYDANGHVDYGRRAQAYDFQAGIDRLVTLGRTSRTSFMCAEENPGRCHRRLLVTPALEKRGLDVVHIRGSGELQPEEAMRQPSPQLQLFE